ncbi:MAG: N-acetylmuramoyl-L-alanine amidase [Opitutaceae bacterium]|nr:N-acetylmuramoyl-L-alanine amidase [Opitutaceae bacterium]
MARLHARSLLASAAVLMLTGGCTAPASAQNRAEAGRTIAAPAAAVPVPSPSAPPPAAVPVSRLWPSKRLYNTDYVDVQAIAERYGLKPVWVTSGRILQLVDGRGRVRLKFEDRDRDFYCDGLRVFMGEPVVIDKGRLHVGKIDVIKTIAPLMRPADFAGQLPAPPRLIVLDPGHGGNDPGNQNAGLRLDEKHMTLDVALRLRKLLETRGYKVLLTRTDDRRVELEERDRIAARAKADLFLSIHFNSLPATAAGRVTGSETYVMTPQFMLSSGTEKKDPMTDVAFPGNRQDLANTVLGYHLHRQLLADLKTSDRGYKRARFVVLRFAECPAALIEAAYLSNNLEARKVATPEYRQRIAGAIAGGIDDYAAALAALHPPASLSVETHASSASSR